MAVQSVETGMVSADGALVTFYCEVFELEELEALEFPQGTVRRMRGPAGHVIKIMVPAAAPAKPATAETFIGMSGYRYMTVRVDDLDGVVERAAARGGFVTMGPLELRPGVQLVVLTDPDGNTIEVMQDT